MFPTPGVQKHTFGVHIATACPSMYVVTGSTTAPTTKTRQGVTATCAQDSIGVATPGSVSTATICAIGPRPVRTMTMNCCVTSLVRTAVSA